MSLTVLVALVLGVVGLLARRTEGSWIAPAPLLAAFWTPILFVAGLTFATLDGLTSSALYVLAAITAVWIGSVLGHGFDPPPGHPARLQYMPLLRTLLVLSLVTGAIEIVSLFVRRGYSAMELFSLSAIFQVTLANRSALFNGLQQSAAEWTVFLVLYTSTLLGGVLFRLSRTRTDIVLSLSAPILLWIVFALYGSRISVLFGGAFWLGAYLTTSALLVEDARIFSPSGLLRTFALTAVLFLGFSIVTQGIRSSESMPEGWRGAFADGFDYPAAMGIWMDQRGFVGSGFTDGARTFARVTGVVGIKAPPLPAIQVEFTTSNIYTVFRDVIEDFGTIGSLFFFALLGWLGRVLFMRARAGRLAVLAPLAALYSFLLTTPADSIFFYTVTIAALVVFTVYVAIALFIVRRRRAGALEEQPVMAA